MRFFFFNKVIRKEAESRTSVHFMSGLNLNKTPMLEAWVFFLLDVRKLLTSTPTLPKQICHCGSVAYPRSPSNSLSGTWKAPAIRCPNFVTCPSESVSVPKLAGCGQAWEIFSATICFSPSHLSSRKLSFQACHPPSSLPPSILGLPTTGPPPPQEILVLMTSTDYCRSRGSIFSTSTSTSDDLFIVLTNSYQDGHTS